MDLQLRPPGTPLLQLLARMVPSCHSGVSSNVTCSEQPSLPHLVKVPSPLLLSIPLLYALHFTDTVLLRRVSSMGAGTLSIVLAPEMGLGSKDTCWLSELRGGMGFENFQF